MDTLRDPGCEANAQGPENRPSLEGVGAIGPLLLGRSLRFAEHGGAKVIVDTDLPESILTALAALVDATRREFGDAMAQRLAAEADQPKPLCRWHPGQYRDYCSPCRSERIGRRDDETPS